MYENTHRKITDVGGLSSDPSHAFHWGRPRPRVSTWRHHLALPSQLVLNNAGGSDDPMRADTEALANGRRVRKFRAIGSVARRKLRQLQIAERLGDLRVPPGNRLERLKGKRAGQHSIRINDQFRVCFRWTAAGARDVEIVDTTERRVASWRN